MVVVSAKPRPPGRSTRSMAEAEPWSMSTAAAVAAALINRARLTVVARRAKMEPVFITAPNGVRTGGDRHHGPRLYVPFGKLGPTLVRYRTRDAHRANITKRSTIVVSPECRRCRAQSRHD